MLDLVGAAAAAAAAEGSFARVWPPNGTLTAIGFCCVVCGRGVAAASDMTGI